MFTVEHNNGVTAADVQRAIEICDMRPLTRVDSSRIQLPIWISM
jgi:hypothetical protein